MGKLAWGSQGNEVRQLQELLNQVLDGESPLKVDGIFGPKTNARVIVFQKQAKLAADGIVGPKTNRALVGAVLSANIRGE
jgi:peptidoglycan hydrolase-like protein with peptidoglycan-binding domain